jgi:hypothetical protein
MYEGYDVTCVPLGRTDVSEEHVASISRVKQISELETALSVTSHKRSYPRRWRSLLL